MTYVVTENCIQCKFTDCVDICPVDAFYEGPNFLVISPAECIDCNACVAECPAEAIYADDRLPPGQEHFIKLNEELSEKWPNLSRKKPALPEAEKWNGKLGKIALLEIPDNERSNRAGKASEAFTSTI